MAVLEPKAGTGSFESEIAALFATARGTLPGAAWLGPLRAEALVRVMREGLPHKRLESWKYTDLRGKYSGGLELAESGQRAEHRLLDDLNCHRVEINGGKTLVLPAPADCQDGFELLGLGDVLVMPALGLRQWLQPSDDVVDNLNLAFATDGAVIRVGRGVKVERPVMLRSTLAQSGVMAHCRSVVTLEEGAELTLIEIDDGQVERQSFCTSVTFFVLEAGARLRHLRLSARQGSHVGVRRDVMDLDRDAVIESVLLSAGSAMDRQQMTVRLNGTGASFDLACAYAAAEGQHTDFTLEAIHEASHTTSQILTKGVATGNGRGVVQGRVVVRPDAQKSDSHQMSKALLLSPGAEIDQKPELEIFADDVKCGHGATIGAIDLNQLFYLQSRGISERQARQMLVSAFTGEVTERVPASCREGVEHWFAGHMMELGQ